MRCFLALALVCAAACSNAHTELVGPAKEQAASMDAAVGRDAALDAAAVPAKRKDGGPRVPAFCGGQACACDDGEDQDGDTLVDGLDPECTGAYDDDEASFATGLPGGSGDTCRDCFWDANAGRGDDGCEYPRACLLGEEPSGGNCSSCQVSATCIDRCEVLTPNGCDCFGCCEVTRQDGSRLNIALTETCSLDALDDQTRCPRCDPRQECRNPCGTCELCPGRKPQDLPALCNDESDVPRPVCDEGQLVCEDSSDCGAEHYCLLGCCLRIVQ